MKIGKALLIGVLPLLGPFASHVAEAGGQAGGVPTLDTRVRVLETTVADQGATGAALQVTVDDLQTQLNSVQNDLARLEGLLPLFAVVDQNGTLRPSSSRGVLSAGHFLDDHGNPETGFYRVVFTRDVSRCAATVTAEPSYSGQITASINGTFRGVSNNLEFPPTNLTIVLFDEDHNLIDARFNVIVTC